MAFSPSRTSTVKDSSVLASSTWTTTRPSCSFQSSRTSIPSLLRLANLDIVRDRSRAFAEAWRSAWPDVAVAYSVKANRLPAILRAIGEQGVGFQIGSEAEYRLMRSLTDADRRSIVVQGP